MFRTGLSRLDAALGKFVAIQRELGMVKTELSEATLKVTEEIQDKVNYRLILQQAFTRASVVLENLNKLLGE